MASRRLRVLIADDHPGIVKSASRLLAFDCDVVGSAVDCDSLAEAAQRLKPDVIVLDLSLPNGHGLKVCRQLMKDNPGMRFIVFTAADDADVRQRALEAGASAFVHKLVVDGDLLSAVRRIASEP